jgi:hypothetical protein
MRLHSDIARCLSSSDELSALKPTASVTPQVKLDAAADEEEKLEIDPVSPASLAVGSTAAMTFSQTSLAQPAEASKSCRLQPDLSKIEAEHNTSFETPANDIDWQMPNGICLNCRTVPTESAHVSAGSCISGLNNIGCSSSAVAASLQLTNMHSDEASSVSVGGFVPEEIDAGYQNSIGVSDWSHRSMRSTVHSDELAAAHVLSGIGQLAAVAAAAAAIPNTTAVSSSSSAQSLQPESYSESSSLNCVSAGKYTWSLLLKFFKLLDHFFVERYMR